MISVLNRSRWSLIGGDVLRGLRVLEDDSVHCVVTSPPYWQMRDYGHPDQIGLDPTIGEYVDRMVAVFRDVRRVLRPDGTLWLNLGDTYLGGRCGGIGTSGITSPRNHVEARKVREALGGAAHRKAEGLAPKNLMGVPWRVAFALQADGWVLRQEIIWEKPTAMPESVTDRPTSAHEQVFLFAASPTYFYDKDAAREPAVWGARQRDQKARNGKAASAAADHVRTRNWRSVWTILNEPTHTEHTASFPREFARRCIVAGCPKDGVLDPFAGTGTTGAVAIGLGRRFVGIELVHVDTCRESLEFAARCPGQDRAPRRARSPEGQASLFEGGR